MKNTDKKFMDLKSLVQYIPLTTSTIYTMVSKGKIPFHKIGQKLIFDKQEIDDWVRDGGKVVSYEIQTPKFLKINK